jgi:hypothetical protein
VSDENPANFRDELKRRRELRAAQMQEATPVRLVGRYPAPVAVAAAAAEAPEPPAITLELPPSASMSPSISHGASPRKVGPNHWIIGLMLVPAVVALVSTSLLLYVLLLEKHPNLFAANESGEPVQGAEEPEEQHTGPRIAPRYGSIRSGHAERVSAPPPEPQPQPQAEPIRVPETATISIGVQPQMQPPPEPMAPAVEPPTPEAPQAAAPPAPLPTQLAQAPAASPQANTAAPVQRVPSELIAQWGDPGLQPAQTGAPAVPSDAVLLLLIRSSLFALHQSNMTGNYQFLQGISSVPFQNANPPGKLFQVFANLRNRGVDLSPVMIMQPKLIAKPEVNQRGVLRISGFFPVEPERIYFDLKFLRGPQGRWRLFGITADKLAPKPKAEQAAAPAAAQAAPSQLAPTDAEAAEPPAAAPAPAVPPLPDRKPAMSAATDVSTPEGEAIVGGNEETAAGTTIENVHDRVDEAGSQPADKKRFWPFRRRDSEE